MQTYKCCIWCSLLALGLERHLDPKYHTEKSRRVQFQLMTKALSHTISSILLAKTFRQSFNRVKNIRCRARDSPNHPVLVSWGKKLIHLQVSFYIFVMISVCAFVMCMFSRIYGTFCIPAPNLTTTIPYLT